MNISLKKAPIILFLIATPLVFIAGLRPIGIDKDSLSYASVLDTTFQNAGFYDKEPFFWIFVFLNQYFFSGKAQTFFFAFALIGVYSKIYAIKRLSLFPILSFITYILLYFILHEMTQIRAGIASAVFLLAVPDIASRNFKNFLLKLFFACTWHYSAIIMLPLFFLKPEKIHKIFYMVLPLIGITLSLLKNFTLATINYFSNSLPSILSEKIQIYILLLDSGIFSNINIFNFYYTSLLFLYIFLILNLSKLKLKYDIILLKILGLSLFSYYSLSAVPVWAFRISEFFGVVLIILIPHTLFLFKKKLAALVPITAWMIIYFFAISINQNISYK